MKKADKIFLLLLITVSLFSTVSQAGSVTLWATNHDQGDRCSQQINLLGQLIETHPDQIQIADFIFAPESKSNLRSDLVVGIDDPVVSDYIKLFVHSTKAFNDMAVDFLSDQTPQNNYENYTGLLLNYLALLFDSYSFPNLHPIAQKIMARDKKKPYMQLIQGDLDFARNQITEGKDLFRESRKDKTKAGAGVRQILINHFTHGASAFHSLDLRNAIDSYVQLTQNIAGEYYNKKILPDPEKYNFKIDVASSMFYGKNTFTIVNAEFLFANNLYMNQYRSAADQANYDPNKIEEVRKIAINFWREKFMAQNIIQLMRNHPESKILVWFGIGHMVGLTKRLMVSQEVEPNEIKQIFATSATTDPELACDYKKVLDSFEHEKPDSLGEWYLKNGDREASYKVFVFDMYGNQVYKNDEYKNSITPSKLERNLSEKMKKIGLPSASYIYRVSTTADHVITIRKIIL